MRKTAKFGMSLLSAAVLACVSAPASAELLSTSANSYNFSWSYDSNTAAGLLGGSGVMTATGFNTSTLTLNITLGNSSTVGGQGGDRLVSFGFGIDPDADLRSIVFGDGTDGGMVAAGGRRVRCLRMFLVSRSALMVETIVPAAVTAAFTAVI